MESWQKTDTSLNVQLTQDKRDVVVKGVQTSTGNGIPRT